jgi:hypothetical protein
MTKESGFCVRPNYKRNRGSYAKMEGAGGANNVEGILMALRYLTLEAEVAGLTELAITLEDAAVQCGRYIASSAGGIKGTQ